MFHNREHAGKLLGQRVRQVLSNWPALTETIIIGLPRGGVVVAYEVALALNAPLSILVSKKIGAPGQPELAIGAVSSVGIIVLEEQRYSFDLQAKQYVSSTAERLLRETKALEEHWLKAAGLTKLTVEGKVVVIVDDGVATGMTTLAAIRSIKTMGAASIVLATPVIAVNTSEILSKECNQIVALLTPTGFSSVGAFYEDFQQVEDEEMVQILKRVAGNS